MEHSTTLWAHVRTDRYEGVRECIYWCDQTPRPVDIMRLANDAFTFAPEPDWRVTSVVIRSHKGREYVKVTIEA